MCGGELVVGFFVGPCCACLCAGLLGEFAVRGRDLPGQFRVVARAVVDFRFRDGDIVLRVGQRVVGCGGFLLGAVQRWADPVS